MFKLNPNPTFWAKFKLSVPGGSPVPVEIEFKHLSENARREFWDNRGDKTDIDMLAELIVNWRQFDGPYSADTLKTLADNYPLSISEIFGAYRAEMYEAKVKN